MGDMEETPNSSFEAYGRTKKPVVKNGNTQCDAAGRKMASDGPQSSAKSRQRPSDKSQYDVSRTKREVMGSDRVRVITPRIRKMLEEGSMEITVGGRRRHHMCIPETASMRRRINDSRPGPRIRTLDFLVKLG